MAGLESIADFHLAVDDKAGPENGIPPDRGPGKIVLPDEFPGREPENDRLEYLASLAQRTGAVVNQKNPPEYAVFCTMSIARRTR